MPYDDAVLNWVVYSHDEMGYKAGEWLADDFRAKGNFEPEIVVLWGPAASEISKARGGGVLRALEEAKDIDVTVVYEAHADFNRELAYNETERALAAHDFDAIVGLNSYMAVSAKNALLANGKKPGEITVVAWEGRSTSCKRWLLARSVSRRSVIRDPWAALPPRPCSCT